MKTYYIQRCILKNVKNREIVGIDSAFSMEYMGSAEFEFSALPKSLRRICPNLASYQIYKVKEIKAHDGRNMFLVCRSDQDEEVRRIIAILAKGDFSRDIDLKERAQIRDALDGDKFTETDMWWDIENDWFACLGKNTAKTLILALTKLRERWSESK